MLFCNRSTILLDTNDTKDVISKIKRMIDIRPPKIYNFTKFNNDLDKNHYLLTFKTNGSRFLLFLTTINCKKYSLFIHCDNIYRLNIYNVKLRFDANLYNNTLIEGELLLNDKQNWIFMCNNILYYENNYIGNQYLGYRINVIADILRNKYKYDDYLNICHLQLRSYFLFNHLEMLTNTHNNELLLVPELYNKPILSFVIKDLDKNEKIITRLSNNYDNISIKRFFVMKTETPDVFELYADDTFFDKNDKIKEQKFRGIACISTISHSFYMKKCFDEMKELDKGLWIKFSYNSELKGWQPII